MSQAFICIQTFAALALTVIDQVGSYWPILAIESRSPGDGPGFWTKTVTTRICDLDDELQLLMAKMASNNHGRKYLQYESMFSFKIRLWQGRRFDGGAG